MPGIYGLLATDSDVADLPAALSAMAGRVRHHPWYVEHHHLDAGAGLALGRTSLGFVNTAPQPAFNEDGTLLAVMEGEIYDPHRWRRELALAGHDFRTDSQAEVLLHGFEDDGPGFFRRLDGMFAAAIWDARRRRLVLINDRFGMRPLYYARRPGRLLLASEIKALLADPELPRRLDRRGVAQFFHFGQPLGEDTLIESIWALPAAAWVTFDPDDDRLDVGRYWRPEVHDPISEPEALDRIDAAFKQAVDRRVADTGRLGLSLSGGLDSRAILGVIDHDRVPIATVCLGIEGSIDHRSAERMAALVGCPHYKIHLGSDFLEAFEEHLARMVHLTDGHHLSQCVATPTIPAYRDLGIDVLLRGHAGELMHLDKAYNFSIDREALAIRDGEGLERWLLDRLTAFVSGAELASLFAGPLGAEMSGLARESLRDCLRESEGFDPPTHRIWHLFLTQRLRRETALSMAEFGALVEPRLPFLDGDLIDALLAAPAELKRGDRIQAHILRKRRPEFLDVVNANTGTRLGAGRLELLAAKARLKVFSKLRVRGYQPYERLGLWLRRELRPLVTRLLLDDRCLGRGVFAPEALGAVVADHFGGRRNHTFLLMALMIFEVGQRQFIDEEAQPTPETSRSGRTEGLEVS